MAYWVYRYDGSKFKTEESARRLKNWAGSFEGKYRPRIVQVGNTRNVIAEGRNIKRPVVRRVMRPHGFVPFGGL